MIEIKTLQDLKEVIEVVEEPLIHGYLCVRKSELKQNIIKIIKDDDFSTEEIVKRWGKFNKFNDIIKTMATIKSFLKWFGNITEEDLC